jgi:hypothetical protein
MELNMLLYCAVNRSQGWEIDAQQIMGSTVCCLVLKFSFLSIQDVRISKTMVGLYYAICTDNLGDGLTV